MYYSHTPVSGRPYKEASQSVFQFFEHFHYPDGLVMRIEFPDNEFQSSRINYPVIRTVLFSGQFHYPYELFG